MFDNHAKRPLTKQDKRYLVLILVGVLIFLGFFAFYNQTTDNWDGDGTISVYPNNDQAKNYTLDAQDISVTRIHNGWFQHQDSYSIDSAVWPNGGELDFYPSCKINYPASSAICKSNSGTYRVQVISTPAEPSSDSDPNS